MPSIPGILKSTIELVNATSTNTTTNDHRSLVATGNKTEWYETTAGISGLVCAGIFVIMWIVSSLSEFIFERDKNKSMKRHIAEKTAYTIFFPLIAIFKVAEFIFSEKFVANENLLLNKLLT